MERKPQKKIKDSLTYYTVKQDHFPHASHMNCCESRAEVGDSVLTIPVRDPAGKIENWCFLHKRCLTVIVDKMPLDLKDYVEQFEKLQSAMLATGDPFPQVD